MSKQVRVPDTVAEKAEEVQDEYDMTQKEAIRHMCRTGGFDV